MTESVGFDLDIIHCLTSQAGRALNVVPTFILACEIKTPLGNQADYAATHVIIYTPYINGNPMGSFLLIVRLRTV